MLDSPCYFYYSLCVVKERVIPPRAMRTPLAGRNCILKFLIALSGGDNRDRTGNLQLAKLALSQLSYIPI